jgi:hypothetical protein
MTFGGYVNLDFLAFSRGTIRRRPLRRSRGLHEWCSAAEVLLLLLSLVTDSYDRRRSWPSENISGQTKRAAGIAMQITIGYLGAVTGVLVYQPEFPTQHFRKPHIIAIGHLTFSIVVAGVLWHRMASENRRRAEMIAAGKDKIVGRETKVLLGDREIHWKYRV